MLIDYCGGVSWFLATSGRANPIKQEMYTRPYYTFSLYLYIVIYALAAVVVATFSDHYLHLAHELEDTEQDCTNCMFTR